MPQWGLKQLGPARTCCTVERYNLFDLLSLQTEEGLVQKQWMGYHPARSVALLSRLDVC